MKNILFIATIILLSACGARLMMPTQADANRGAAKFAGLTLADLEKGKSIFEHNCNKCHPLKSPTGRNEEKWNKVVPRMVYKVNHKMHETRIDSASQVILLHYLVTMSTAPKKKK